jgi:hypothetical protein
MKRRPMSRGKPLSRSSSIKRSAKPIARKKRIAPRSKKRRDLYGREGGRRDFVRDVLARRPWCEAGPLIRSIAPTWECWGCATQVHEKTPRGRGGRIVGIADSDVVAVCGPCHTSWIHTHPAQSIALGLMRGSHGN